MQRQDYLLISASVRAAIEQINKSAYSGSADYGLGLRVGVEYAAIKLAEALSARTTAFDTVRFLRDCGVPSFVQLSQSQA